MVQSPEEKRKALRHSYASPVTYTGKVSTPSMPPQEVLFQGKIVDLSSGGIAMPSVPVNVPVLARVQWVRDKDHGPSQRVGLMFVV